MQKRAANAIRGLVESDNNPIVSIHDHGAGGHLNCLSELVEEQGGLIDLDKLPVGDPTLSAKEIIGNESQERMGLVIGEKDIEILQKWPTENGLPCIPWGCYRRSSVYFPIQIQRRKANGLRIGRLFWFLSQNDHERQKS